MEFCHKIHGSNDVYEKAQVTETRYLTKVACVAARSFKSLTERLDKQL